jgi:hypothetical protein
MTSTAHHAPAGNTAPKRAQTQKRRQTTATAPSHRSINTSSSSSAPNRKHSSAAANPGAMSPKTTPQKPHVSQPPTSHSQFDFSTKPSPKHIPSQPVQIPPISLASSQPSSSSSSSYLGNNTIAPSPHRKSKQNLTTPPFASISLNQQNQPIPQLNLHPIAQPAPLLYNITVQQLQKDISASITPPQSQPQQSQPQQQQSQPLFKNNQIPNININAQNNPAPKKSTKPIVPETQKRTSYSTNKTAPFVLQPNISPPSDLFNGTNLPTMTAPQGPPKAVAPKAMNLNKLSNQTAEAQFQFRFSNAVNVAARQQQQQSQQQQQQSQQQNPINVNKRKFTTININNKIGGKIQPSVKKSIISQCKLFFSTATKKSKSVIKQTRRLFLNSINYRISNRLSSAQNRERLDESEPYKLHRQLNDQYWDLPQNHNNTRFMQKYEGPNMGISQHPIFYTQTPTDGDIQQGMGTAFLKIPMSKMETNLDELKKQELAQGSYQGWDQSLLEQINPDGSLKLDANNTSQNVLLKQHEKNEKDKNGLYFDMSGSNSSQHNGNKN